MSAARAFVDSNVVLCLLSADADRADRAEAVIADGAICSAQVLNEVANVARRKLGMPWQETGEFLAALKSLCPAQPLTVETHDKGLELAGRYGLSVYDGLIVAAALLADCETLWSEDMHDGLLIEERLRIRNPFAARRVQESAPPSP